MNTGLLQSLPEFVPHGRKAHSTVGFLPLASCGVHFALFFLSFSLSPAGFAVEEMGLFESFQFDFQNSTTRTVSRIGLAALSTGKWDIGFILRHASVLLLTFLATTVIHRRYFSPISHIPGPLLASFSRWWHLRQIWRGDQQIQIARMHEKHGPYVRIAHDEVSIVHPDVVKKLLIAPLHKADWYKIFVLPDYRVLAPLAVATPKDKIQLNKHFRPGFDHAHILRIEQHMDDVLLKLFGQIGRAAEERRALRLGEFFSYAAYDVTGEVTFSRNFGFTEKGEDIGGAVATNEQMEMFFTILGYFRWFSYLICNPLTTWLEILPLGYMGAISKAALEERRKNPDARFDIAAHWFRALEEYGPSTVWNEARILAAAISNLGAGSDTVSCALQSFTYHMIRTPGCWEKARAEIDAAQASQGLCRDAVVNFEDASKLPYLQAALKEALRIFAPVPMGLPRVAPKGGVTFDDGKHFPEGTVLSVSPYALMTSKAIFGPDADKFRPERWLECSPEELALMDRSFCPWGGGWGVCPGQNIARIQMSKVAVSHMPARSSTQHSPLHHRIANDTAL
jgi:cytochrome P450